MILKLCYQNEIHRISEPPTQLSDFYTLLLTTFRTQLPERFSVSYSIKGEVENVPVTNQDDYTALLAMGPSKTAKVFIQDETEVKDSNPADYDIISNKTKEAAPIYEEERKVENARDLGELIQNVSESVIIPQAQKYPYIAPAAGEDKDESTRRIVKQVLHDQMPYIIAQVKEAVLKELRGPVPVYQQHNVEHPRAQQPKEDKKIDINARDSEVVFQNADYYPQEEPERIPERPEAVEKNDLLNKMKMFGNALKDKLVVLPGKAKDAFDDVAQKLEGDPYVVVEEGKFPKSVVDKANLLKEVFPEEDRTVLLNFVKQYPRNATLEQLANLYLVKDEPQAQEQAQPQEQNNA